MTDRSATAADLFTRKFNCAQSVLAAFAPDLGLDEATALRLASPFGAGMARRGEVCGAVSGALLVLGLWRGSDSPQGKENTYRLAQEFLARFEQEHGSLICRALLGYNICDPQELENARLAGVFEDRCPFFVRGAAASLASMLEAGD